MKGSFGCPSLQCYCTFTHRPILQNIGGVMEYRVSRSSSTSSSPASPSFLTTVAHARHKQHARSYSRSRTICPPGVSAGVLALPSSFGCPSSVPPPPVRGIFWCTTTKTTTVPPPVCGYPRRFGCAVPCRVVVTHDDDRVHVPFRETGDR